MGCHIDEGVGWSMEDPEEACQRLHSIALMVTSGSMPPWLADSHDQEYVDDLSLPPLPGDAYAPAPSMANDHRCFIVDWPREEPGYETRFRMEPGNPGVAHRALLDVVEPEMVEGFRELEEEDGPGHLCFSNPAVPDRPMEWGDAEARAASETRHPGGVQDLRDGVWRFEVWAPGTRGRTFPEGTGVRIEPGSAIAAQMHYFKGNAPPDEVDAGARIHLQVADQTERRAFVFLQTWTPLRYGEANRSMVIPPGDSARSPLSTPTAARRRFSPCRGGISNCNATSPSPSPRSFPATRWRGGRPGHCPPVPASRYAPSAPLRAHRCMEPGNRFRPRPVSAPTSGC